MISVELRHNLCFECGITSASVVVCLAVQAQAELVCRPAAMGRPAQQTALANLVWAVGETRARLERWRDGWEARLRAIFGGQEPFEAREQARLGGRERQVQPHEPEAREAVDKYADTIASMLGCHETMQERLADFVRGAAAEQQFLAAAAYALIRTVRCPAPQGVKWCESRVHNQGCESGDVSSARRKCPESDACFIVFHRLRYNDCIIFLFIKVVLPYRKYIHNSISLIRTCAWTGGHRQPPRRRPAGEVPERVQPPCCPGRCTGQPCAACRAAEPCARAHQRKPRSTAEQPALRGHGAGRAGSRCEQQCRRSGGRR